MHVPLGQAFCVDAGVRTQAFIAGFLRTEPSHQPQWSFIPLIKTRDKDRKIAGLKVWDNVGQKELEECCLLRKASGGHC